MTESIEIKRRIQHNRNKLERATTVKERELYRHNIAILEKRLAEVEQAARPKARPKPQPVKPTAKPARPTAQPVRSKIQPVNKKPSEPEPEWVKDFFKDVIAARTDPKTGIEYCVIPASSGAPKRKPKQPTPASRRDLQKQRIKAMLQPHQNNKGDK